MTTDQLKRIFIVDDDPFWTAMLAQILTDLNYGNIIILENGEDCIDHMHLNPHFVFLDYQMEEMNGLEVLAKIKDYYPGIHVVFCTANEDLSIAISALSSGSFDYLLKSNANKKELAELISRMEKQKQKVALTASIV